MWSPTASSISSALSGVSFPPHFCRVSLPFGLWNPPRRKEAEEQRCRRKDKVHFPLAELLIHHWEELGDGKRGDPIGRQRPTLRGADGLGTDELAREDERNRPQPQRKRRHKRQDHDARQRGDVVDDGDGQHERRHAHAGNREQQARLAAELVRQGRAEQRDDGSDEGDEHVDGRGGRRQHVGQHGDAVHHHRVYAARLLRHHDADDGHGRFVVLWVHDHAEDADSRALGGFGGLARC